MKGLPDGSPLQFQLREKLKKREKIKLRMNPFLKDKNKI